MDFRREFFDRIYRIDRMREWEGRNLLRPMTMQGVRGRNELRPSRGDGALAIV